MNRKLHVMLISDSIISLSGVGHQAREIAFSLLRSGRFTVYNVAGAIKHQSYDPIRIEEFGENLTIQPCDGFGDQDTIRSMIRMQRPDIILVISDPRFFLWLFAMEDEIRSNSIFMYYNIWDSEMLPKYNTPYYASFDKLIPISKVTEFVNRSLVPHVDIERIGHSVNDKIFTKLPKEMVQKFREDTFRIMGKPDMKRMIFFWNSRNARRKLSGSVIWFFKEFLDIVGHDKATLLMHTQTKDAAGQDLDEIVEERGLTQGQVMFSREPLSQEALAMLYNMADATISISNAEGWGLSVSESLACGTPCISTLTGGQTEQIIDSDGDHCGVGIIPCSRTVIGGVDVTPYIWEDNTCQKDVVDALLKFYNMSPEEREALGEKGKKHITTTYNYDKFVKRWPELMQEAYDKWGSWETRKGYKPYNFVEIK